MTRYKTIDYCQLQEEPAAGATSIAAIDSGRIAITWDQANDTEATQPLEAGGFVFVKTAKGQGWIPKGALAEFPRTEINKADFVRACLAAEFDNHADARLAPFYAPADLVIARAMIETGISNGSPEAAGPVRFGPLATTRAEWDIFLHNVGNPTGTGSSAGGAGEFSKYGWDDPIEAVWGATARISSDARILKDIDAKAGNVAFGDGLPSLLDIFIAYLLNSCTAAHSIARDRAREGGLPAKSCSEYLAANLASDSEVSQVFERYSEIFGKAAGPDTMAEVIGRAASRLDELLAAAAAEIATAAPEYTASGAGGTGVVDGGPLGRLIASAESGSKGYQAYNRGVAGDTSQAIDFAKMTVGELRARQARPKGDPERIFAFGKYQVIPSTFIGAIRALKVTPDTLVSDGLQERVFRQYLIRGKRRAVVDYITGLSRSPLAAQTALALEFAAIGLPGTGRSAYGGVGGNKASIAPHSVALALDEERSLYASMREAGVSPEDAWQALSLKSGEAVPTGEPPQANPGAGSSGLVVEKALQALRANAGQQSKGLCARYVRMALKAGGVTIQPADERVPTDKRVATATPHDRWTDAKYYRVHLAKKHFLEIPRDGFVARKGDIAVIENHEGGHRAGHICMFTGTQWVSDFVQSQGYYPGPQYRALRPPVRFFRP